MHDMSSFFKPSSFSFSLLSITPEVMQWKADKVRTPAKRGRKPGTGKKNMIKGVTGKIILVTVDLSRYENGSIFFQVRRRDRSTHKYCYYYIYVFFHRMVSVRRIMVYHVVLNALMYQGTIHHQDTAGS